MMRFPIDVMVYIMIPSVTIIFYSLVFLYYECENLRAARTIAIKDKLVDSAFESTLR